MKLVEKLGQFYLGKVVNPTTGKSSDKDLLLYDSKNLTTHAICVGMTGSGKTGLGIGLIEEAGLDQIPVIAIDPKGDLGNLLLTFPDLSPEQFQPWIDADEAQRKGSNVADYAKEMAVKWKDGLEEWGEGQERVRNFRKSVDLAIYTPASNAGLPISILSSFAAPDASTESTELRDRIQTTTSSLLGLLGIAADPIKSREHILISALIEDAWRQGQDLDLGLLIQQVQKPPFKKIGALDVDTFYPPKDRMQLSISLNNLLASPGFKAWMEGGPLDIKELLYTKEGKPKVSVISIAHLSDSERMFFVTLLLNEFIAWMRRQDGTSSLRALLYMDEIFGFFPPVASPPSKLPMLTLLKQARAFGVGVVLATQNPVDLDYKGLANCGTWFIGKLQTERDKNRVLEGLNAASNGELDTKQLDKMIASTGNRVFMMRSIYEKEPILFQTRWTLSYLRGPLTLSQIASLTGPKPTVRAEKKPKTGELAARAPTPSGVQEYFLNAPNKKEGAHYEPRILAIGKLHFVDAKCDLNTWKEVWLVFPFKKGGEINWDAGEELAEDQRSFDEEPRPNATFGEVPEGLLEGKQIKQVEKAFAAALYQNQTYALYEASDYDMLSNDDESEGDFRVRVAHTMREDRDAQTQEIKESYADRLTVLNNRLNRAQLKMGEKKQRFGMQMIYAFFSFLQTILNAFLGKKITKTTITQAGTSMRRSGQIYTEKQRADTAEEEVKACEAQIEETEDQMNQEIAQIAKDLDPSKIALDTIKIPPRKGDIDVQKIALLWM